MYIRIALFFLLLLGLSAVYAQDSGIKNYEVTINGKTYDIALDETSIFTNKNQEIQISFKKKDIVEYSDTMISFKHKSDANISSSDLGSGITQLLFSTAVGSGFLVQEYSSLNPSIMVDLMIQELTKQDISYGYQSQTEDITFNTADGKLMKGKKSTLTYNKSVKVYQVLSYGIKDYGVLLINFYDMDFYKQDKPVLDLMTGSFKIKP